MSSSSSRRLFLSDFDGTLVGPDLTISDRVKKAVHAWQEAGNIFTIITGRTYSGVLEKACHELKVKNIIVSRGGAEVWDPTTNKRISAIYLENEDVEKIVAVLRKHNIYFEIGKEKGVYASKKTERYKDIWKMYLPIESVTYSEVSKIRAFFFPDQKIDFDTIIHDEIIQNLPRVHAIKAHDVHFQSYDITSAKATKYMAALEMMKHFSISEEHTRGIGDGYNDYPLLSAAGKKVAMENAPDELKEIADVIAPTEEEDGVAVILEKLLKE